jgi:mono/diheme cytochrome c family protein
MPGVGLIRAGMAAATIVAAASIRPGAAMENATLAAGKALAERACSACHQIGPEQGTPPADQDGKSSVRGPSFASVARDPRNDVLYLRSFIRFPHYPMREQLMSDKDVDSLVAYILSLRSPARPNP